ncbi:MAG TPA: cytochrome c biogenesis protein CcdA [Planctomycetota bacterium]|jgi:cytochrome c biogenesis protein CcdA
MNEYLLGALGAIGYGLLTAIYPCPLTANLAALSFLCGQARTTRRALAAGLLFALGLAFTYSLLALLLVWGALSVPVVAEHLQFYSRRLAGPLLILVGMLLAGLLGSWSPTTQLEKFSSKDGRDWSLWFSFPLGGLIALSFCPASAGLFFGALLPLAVGQGSTLLYPVLYSLGVALPVIITILLCGRGMEVARARLKSADRVVRTISRCAGAILIAIGIYFSLRDVYQFL